MFTGVYSDTSRNQSIKRIGSLDSIFQQSPPKSFAIEVAEALCCRAKVLGSSHPSVVTRKQKKLMEGLINVAEAIRNDSPVCKEQIVMTPPNSNVLLLSDDDTSAAYGGESTEALIAEAAITHDDAMKSSVPAIIDGDVKDTVVDIEAFIKGLDVVNSENEVNDPSQIQVSDPNDAQYMESAASIEIPGRSAFGDVANESNSIHLRLAYDYSDPNYLSWVRNNIKPTEKRSTSPQAQNQWKPPKPNKSRLRKRITKASVINFFRRRLKRTKSEKKMKFRDQMSTFINSDGVRNFRKSCRNVWSVTKKTTEMRITQMKSSLFKSHKN